MIKTTNKFAPEVRERAVGMVSDHKRDYPSRWAAMVSIVEKAEVDSGKRLVFPPRLPTR